VIIAVERRAVILSEVESKFQDTGRGSLSRMKLKRAQRVLSSKRRLMVAICDSVIRFGSVLRGVEESVRG
jgi:hypothetical protein